MYNTNMLREILDLINVRFVEGNIQTFQRYGPSENAGGFSAW